MVAATIELVNPAWTWGLAAAVALPLLAHLLSSRGGRLAAFPAVRFLQQAASDTSRLLRPRHWLLMLLRTVALAAIVLAIAQPVWFGQALASSGGQGLAVVIIVDRTASMTRTSGGATLFDEARRRTIDVLENLDPSRDLANVIVLDDAPHAILPAAGANFAALIAQLETIEPGLTHADAAAAIALARAELRRLPPQPHRQPRIEIISDMQASQWGDGLRDQAVPMRIHRMGREQGNVAVFEPVCSVARAVAEQAAAVTLQVGNFSPRRREVMVALTHHDRVTRQSVLLDAYATGAVVFNFTPTSPGTAALSFGIEHEGDAVPFDDRTGLAIPVAAARPVALVTAASIDDPNTAAFFISRALRAEGSGIATVVRRPGEAIGREVDAVIVVEAEDTASEIARGQASVIQMMQADERGGFSVGEVQTDSPLLDVFEGAALQTLLQARFAYRATATDSRDRTLMAFSDGSPLLTVADRRATIWADLSPRSTDFVKGPAFAPLLHQLIRGMAPPPPARSPNITPTSRDPVTPGLQPDGRWVELAASESDLRAVDSGDAGVASSRVVAHDAAVGLRGRTFHFWPVMLTIGVLCLIAEPLAAQWRGGHRDD